MRMVSLLPSATETLFLSGGSTLLVRKSHECDYPAWITPLSAPTQPHIDARGPAGIDATVQARVSRRIGFRWTFSEG